MDLGLAGKVALVAGSSQGLGRAIAEELAAEGAAIALCARNATTLGQVREAIAAAAGVRVTAEGADLSKGEDVRRMVESTLHHHGRIDILVTNTGGPPPGPFESHDAAAWRAAA